ncbi:MAG TPA: 16S rRNA (cytosine(1402)-N(4))-methyltransferase, partial [Chthoniobacteraceae bacterium]|nr:16S rRNA (cytosine(1402)-N(4))-methyltransferase [Chthoniobacteraceae bacterium]
MSEPNPPPQPYRRRPRYSGKYPRKFEEKYKELHPADNAETIEKVLASGKTPAGTHRPIMVAEILEVLAPRPGDTVIDCTLGYGGHAQEMLTHIRPGGRLLGIDADPIELPKTEARLRGEGFGPEDLTVFRSNYAGLPQAMEKHQMPVANCILADLGVSSMQIDNPSRGFSTKHEGPLDLRLNPQRGQPAAHWLAKTTPIALEAALVENDEPHAALLAGKLAGRKFATTTELAQAVRRMIPDRISDDDRDLSVRRVFQALRIEVN